MLVVFARLPVLVYHHVFYLGKNGHQHLKFESKHRITWKVRKQSDFFFVPRNQQAAVPKQSLPNLTELDWGPSNFSSNLIATTANRMAQRKPVCWEVWNNFLMWQKAVKAYILTPDFNCICITRTKWWNETKDDVITLPTPLSNFKSFVDAVGARFVHDMYRRREDSSGCKLCNPVVHRNNV